MATSSTSFQIRIRAAGGGMPAVYPLAIVSPREAGTAPPQIAGAPPFPSGHPMLHAHPGVPYRHRACVKGGSYPFVFTLVDAPDGMRVDVNTGLIEWDNPTGSSASATLRVTDAEETVLMETWTIRVGTSGFKFVAENGDDGADGSLEAPWRSLSQVQTGASPNDIVYFREGTYGHGSLHVNEVISSRVVTDDFTPTATSFEVEGTADLTGQALIFGSGRNSGFGVLVTAGMVVGDRFRVTSLHSPLLAPPGEGDEFGVGNTWQRVEWSASSHSVKWLAYPGEQPVLDNGFQSFLTDWGALHRLTGDATNPVYVRGFRHVNILDKGFQLEAADGYHVFAELEYGEGSLALMMDGSNSGAIMCLSGRGTFAWLTHFCDLHCDGALRGALKLYAQRHCVIEQVDTISCESAWDVKAEIPSFEIRGCVMRAVRSLTQGGIHGNMAGDGDNRTSGEIRFNLVDMRDVGPDALAADIGQDGSVGVVDVYRNTFIGRVQVRNIGADDGPVRLTRNVIINADSTAAERVYMSSSEASRVMVSDNLVGGDGDGIVDAAGRLQGEYLDRLGRYGHQI
jgi:hypothetical protein